MSMRKKPLKKWDALENRMIMAEKLRDKLAIQADYFRYKYCLLLAAAKGDVKQVSQILTQFEASTRALSEYVDRENYEKSL